MSVWQEIKEKLDLVDIVSEYISLKNRGYNYLGICPFHKEKTPSFTVSSEKQIWHCFGCGLGGDVFSFVSQIENLEKKDVLPLLAKRANVVLPNLKNSKTNNSQNSVEPKKNSNHYQSGLKYLEWVSRVYHLVLLKILQDPKHPVTQYCRKRKLNIQTIKDFQIGYAPGSDFLLNLSTDSNLDIQILTEIGLLKE